VNSPHVSRIRIASLLAAATLVVVSTAARAQVWDATKFFQYNIENVAVAPAGPGAYAVTVVFSVTNPVSGDTWDIKNAVPFTSAGAALTLDIGLDAADFTNTGSENPTLSPLVTSALGTAALGRGAALPVQVRNLQTTGSTACASTADCPGAVSLVNRFRVNRTVTPVAFVSAVTTGRVAIEGKPVCAGVPGFTCPTTGSLNIPVQSTVASFAFAPADPLHAVVPDPRRKIVDIAKCKQCHDGALHGATVIPRLSLHGNNRTENLGLCVICHNANQTDVPYRYLTSGTTADPRIGGPEVSIDFKRMVHAIHAGGFRTTPFVVIGFGSSVNDFSTVRFPRELRDCTNCHVDANGKGTFELPLKTMLGSTLQTQSTFRVPLATATTLSTRIIDVNPFNDLKISPTAAVCSSCHDKSEVRSHMIRTGGASFATTQAAIGVTVNERCANCHGPGKAEDVRRAHEIGGGGGGESSIPASGETSDGSRHRRGD
jgi:OmcA/MtrC family decaheme c-type cytochrome